MSVVVPRMLGIVFKKNERAKPLISKEVELLKKFSRGRDVILNEDQYLVGFSVAMNGSDLVQTIANLNSSGVVEGEDFVATSSIDGVIGQIPEWLRLESVKEEKSCSHKLYYVELNSA